MTMVGPEKPADAQEPAQSSIRDRRLEGLYREFWDDLCVRLRRVYGEGPPEPEDLAQQAFAKSLEIEDFDTIDNRRGYLFRIAVNAGLDQKRRQSTAMKFLKEEMPFQNEAVLENLTPSNVYESKESLEQLRKGIAALPEKQREIVLRVRLKGESYAEIEAAKGWSKADISRQLKRALEALSAAVNGAE